MYYVRFRDKLNNGEKVWIVILVLVMVTIIKILGIVGNRNLVLWKTIWLEGISLRNND